MIMGEYKEHECPNGAKVRVATTHNDVAQAAFTFYDKWQHGLAFVCPFCGNDDQWDNVTYEADDDLLFEDTYGCDECDTLITLITPNGQEYHNILPCETIYEIEFMFGGEPSTWPDRDEVLPDQPELL